MPYAVNVSKGTVIFNSDIGELPVGIAIPISERQVAIAKHLVGVAVFDSVAGIPKEESKRGNLYGLNKETLLKVTNKQEGKNG